MEFARLIREQVRRALEDAEKGQGSGRSVNIASAINVDGSGHATSVYSDGHVTVVRRDGETRVIHHDQPEAPGEQ
jgi:hypothetical protein